MRYLRLSVIVFLVCLVNVHASQAAQFVNGTGYTITPAPQWTVNLAGLRGADIVIYAQTVKRPLPSLNVVVRSASPGETLQQGLEQVKTMYPRVIPQFKMVKTRYETVDNVRALLIVGTSVQGAQQLLTRQDIVLKNGKVYTFTCTAPATMQAHYAPAFDQMLHSVRWSR